MAKLFRLPSGSYNAEAEREDNYIGRQIARLRRKKGMSLAGLGEELCRRGVDVGSSAIHKWEKGMAAPNAYQLLALGDVFGLRDIGAAFMSGSEPELNEEGLRKLADYRADLVASGRYAPVKTATIEYIEMPVSSLAVSAGRGAFLDDEDFEMLSFPLAVVPEGADFGVRVSGDSMEPVYHHGQIVWVRRCESLSPGQVGVFVYDGEGYLKVYDERMPEAWEAEEFTDSFGCVHPRPVMVSYNRAYEPRTVSPCVDFRVVGRVL